MGDEGLPIDGRYWFEDGYWLAELVNEPKVHTFGPTLEEAKINLADATKLWFMQGYP